MVTDIASLFDLTVYTDKGYYIGKVYDVELDASERRISTLVVENYNKDIINEDAGFNVAELPFDIRQIVRDNRMLGQSAASRYESSRLQNPAEILNFLPMDRFLPDTDLEPIVLGSIVAAGNHDASVDRQIKQ